MFSTTAQNWAYSSGSRRDAVRNGGSDMTVRVDDGGPASVRQRQQVKVPGSSSTHAIGAREPQNAISVDVGLSGCSADDEAEPKFWSRGGAVRAAPTRTTTCTPSPAGDGASQLDNLSPTVLLRLSASQTGREERLQRHQASQDLAEGGWDGCLKAELGFPSEAPGFPCMAPTVTGGVNDHGRQEQGQQVLYEQQQQQQQQGSDKARLQLLQERQQSAHHQRQHRAVLRRFTTSELAHRQALAMKKLAESEQPAAASRQRCVTSALLPPCGFMSARLSGGSSGSRGRGRHCDDCNGVVAEAEAPAGMFSTTAGVSFAGFQHDLQQQQQYQLDGYSLGSSSFGGASSRTSPATPLCGHSPGSIDRSMLLRAAHPEGPEQNCAPVQGGDVVRSSSSDVGCTLAPPRAGPACQAGAIAPPSGVANSRADATAPPSGFFNSRAEALAAPSCSHHGQLGAATLNARRRAALQYRPVALAPTAVASGGPFVADITMGGLVPVFPGASGLGPGSCLGLTAAALSMHTAAANDTYPAIYLYPAAHPVAQGGVSRGGAGHGGGIIEAGAIYVMVLTCLCSLVAVYLFSVGRGQVEELMAAFA